MLSDLPDPHGCPHCGHPGLAERWGEPICGMCHAPRVHATPGCPVRNAVCIDEVGEAVGPLRTSPSGMVYREVRRDGEVATFETVHSVRVAPSIAAETARERRVHGGGPREVR